MIEELEPDDRLDVPVDNAVALRKLCDQLWAATHTADLTPQEVAARLAFLSGVALYPLLEYAKLLERKKDA